MLVKEYLGVNNLFVIYKCSKIDKKCLDGIHTPGVEFLSGNESFEKKKEMTRNGWLSIHMVVHFFYGYANSEQKSKLQLKNNN